MLYMGILNQKFLYFSYSTIKGDGFMTITLRDLLRHRKIKQADVLETMSKCGVDIPQSMFNFLCKKEGDWFSKHSQAIQECLMKEYGIYYDGSVWKGGENYGR